MTRISPSLLFCLALMNATGSLDQDVLEVVASQLARLRANCSRELDA